MSFNTEKDDFEELTHSMHMRIGLNFFVKTRNPSRLSSTLRRILCLGLGVLLVSNSGSLPSLRAAQDSLPSAGALDPDFAVNVDSRWWDDEIWPAVTGFVRRAILVTPEDQILLGVGGLFRINPDGHFDPSFVSWGLERSVNELFYLSDMELDAQGRILVCGKFHAVRDVPREGIARFFSDGRLDESFDPGKAITGGNILALTVQTNGQILIAGTFTAVDGFPRRGIARLNEDGMLDHAFDPFAGVSPAEVNSILVQQDGAILISGPFTSVDGEEKKGFARLQSNGRLDSSFNLSLHVETNGFWGPPRFLTLQPDGKIWISGQFGQTNLFRLKADGGVDLGIGLSPSHSQLISVSGPTVTLQADGKVLVGRRTAPLVRLNSDGTPDASFSAAAMLGPASSPRGPMFTALQSDGRMVIMGDFTQVRSSAWEPRVGIARLYGSDQPYYPPSIVTSSVHRGAGSHTSFQITGAPHFRVVVEASSSLESQDWSPIQTNTLAHPPVTITDRRDALHSKRFYRLVSP